ncbi:MAG TPA: hypothetical protein PLL69_09960, partial [Gemmatimonadales bacterium]|nr:hypothetical protein [Gemmatimonadales bacterium]
MSGITPRPSGTLAERAVELMQGGPVSAEEIAARILGMPGAPTAVAERLAVALLGADPRVRQQAEGRWALV